MGVKHHSPFTNHYAAHIGITSFVLFQINGFHSGRSDMFIEIGITKPIFNAVGMAGFLHAAPTELKSFLWFVFSINISSLPQRGHVVPGLDSYNRVLKRIPSSLLKLSLPFQKHLSCC